MTKLILSFVIALIISQMMGCKIVKEIRLNSLLSSHAPSLFQAKENKSQKQSGGNIHE